VQPLSTLETNVSLWMWPSDRRGGFGSGGETAGPHAH
jgi:hypothetical protein